jgi:hypothetical protein
MENLKLLLNTGKQLRILILTKNGSYLTKIRVFCFPDPLPRIGWLDRLGISMGRSVFPLDCGRVWGGGDWFEVGGDRLNPPLLDFHGFG